MIDPKDEPKPVPSPPAKPELTFEEWWSLSYGEVEAYGWAPRGAYELAHNAWKAAAQYAKPK